jgi:hypothetical protein
MPKIVLVFVVSSLFILIYAIVGVTFFQGVLQTCWFNPTGDRYDTRGAALDQRNCTRLGGVWANPPTQANFDNIGSALMFLFELGTEENWPTLMYGVVDAPREPARVQLEGVLQAEVVGTAVSLGHWPRGRDLERAAG